MSGAKKRVPASPVYILKPGPWLDIDGVVRVLRRATKEAGGAAPWAKAHRMSYENVRLILSGSRMPSRSITKALGLEKALMWRLPAGRKA